MKRLLNLTICLLIVFVSIAFTQKPSAKQTKSKASANKKSQKNQVTIIKEPEICTLPSSVTVLELSHNEIALDCPPLNGSCSSNRIIEITTVALQIDEMEYIYKISGGKIIGQGAYVNWDLSDAKPGSYTIMAGISQPAFGGTRWDIFGMTKTKVVVIK